MMPSDHSHSIRIIRPKLQKILFLLFVFCPSIFADPVKEHELLDFSNIKKILKNDLLEKEWKKKDKKIYKIKKTRKIKKIRQYLVPPTEHFWSFMSEYWLVKNISRLKWDHPRPAYGIGERFKKLLEKMGFYEKEIKILFFDASVPYHFAIPSNKGEYIFLISVPFIKKLDLSQSEIAILLLENFLRIQAGYFRKNVSPADLKKFLGSNFYQKKFRRDIIDNILKNYSETIFKKGFSFKQQFETTKRMSLLLEGKNEERNIYLNVLRKIDTLVKTNKQYKHYLKIYPSPELQLGWMGASHR